jgi:hypothetical protein
VPSALLAASTTIPESRSGRTAAFSSSLDFTIRPLASCTAVPERHVSRITSLRHPR